MEDLKPGMPVPSKAVESDLLETADSILDIDDTQEKDILIPEWKNKKVRIRGLTAQERDQWESSLMKIDSKGNRRFFMDNMRARLLALCIVNSKGQRIFTGDHILALGQKSAIAVSRLYESAQQLSGVTPADEEELVKNFNDTPAEGSPTA